MPTKLPILFKIKVGLSLFLAISSLSRSLPSPFQHSDEYLTTEMLHLKLHPGIFLWHLTVWFVLKQCDTGRFVALKLTTNHKPTNINHCHVSTNQRILCVLVISIRVWGWWWLARHNNYFICYCGFNLLEQYFHF